MKCIVDVHSLKSGCTLPKKLSRFLNSPGANSIHTLDLPDKNRTSDDTILKIAYEEKRIVVTKDNDFLQSHLLKKQLQKLLLVNTGNIGNPHLLQLFSTNFALMKELLVNKDFIELTKEEIVVHD